MSLLISGIVYTPYGDKKGFDVPASFEKTRAGKLSNVNLRGYWDGVKVGAFLEVKKELFDNVPVFYGLGIIKNKSTVGRILRTSLGKSSNEKSLSNPNFLHSWCADLDYVEIGNEKKNPNFIPRCGCSSCNEGPFSKEIEVDRIEVKKISGASIVRNPCCQYTSIFIPNVHSIHNKNLFQAHKNVKESRGGKLNAKLFQDIRMDGYKFKSIFGKTMKRINLKSIANLQKNPDKFLEIARSISFNI